MKHAGGYEDYNFIADLYDYVVPYRGRPDVAFFVEAAEESGGPVLEVGCGTGRVLIPTARAGIEITGLDLSEHMLAVCREKLAREPREVQERADLLLADMRDFDLGRTFALATLPFRPFQHLTTVEDQISCLRTIHRHLQPNGRLILDLFNPKLEALTERSLGEEFALEEPFEMPDGRRVRRAHVVTARDIHEQVMRAELIYYVTYPDGREERLVHAFPMRWLYRFEAEHLLVRCGFEVEALYAGYDKIPYGSVYPGELIFVARAVNSEQ
ncbi:MAG: class I SAM-dependent methyltransferase [Candidatus Promineifilaceae bacterium]